MRATSPLMQNLTNYVAMNIAAKVVLAAGVAHAMVHPSEKVAAFACLAQALGGNISTLDTP